MKKLIVIIPIILVTLMITGCGIKPRGWEAEGIIAVMADSDDWEAVQNPLRKSMEHIIRTPQLETTYTLRYVNTDEFETYTEYRYILLLATLESTGRIGELVNGVVANDEVRAQVERGERYLIVQEGQWSRNQLMIILIAKDRDSLREKIINNESEIYHKFDDLITERMKEVMFEKKEQKELEDRLMSTYNWSMRIQHDYFIAQEFPKDGFLWMRRVYPERWIFVRWIEGADESLLNEEWVISERNRIGSTYYGGDKVVDKYLFSFRDTYLGRPAQITEGLWENEDKVAGGPFKNYTFYDQYTQRIYMIDLALYAPEREKMPYLKRHEIIAQTFKTIFDVEID
ncbi:DUF4837 family protein [bacterium]|nr:DUF4837 family protein [bacterium]